MESDKKKISVFDAVHRARAISEEGGTFAIRFRKYNRDTRSGGDVAYIAKARVRAAASDEMIANSSQKLFIVDTETGRPLVCWQPLIMEIDGIPTELN